MSEQTKNDGDHNQRADDYECIPDGERDDAGENDSCGYIQSSSLVSLPIITFFESLLFVLESARQTNGASHSTVLLVLLSWSPYESLGLLARFVCRPEEGSSNYFVGYNAPT